jgi:hypothetical protein
MATKKKRPESKQPTSMGFLTGGPTMPNEFRPDGMRMLIEHPAFHLVEIWKGSGNTREVVWAEAVRMAYLRSGANKQETRRSSEPYAVLSMMEALTLLADYNGEGSRNICDAMKRALKNSLQAIKSAKSDDDADIAISNATTLSYSAFSGFARIMGSKAKDRRRDASKPTPADLIKIAEFLIEGNARVPSKQEIQKFAEGSGLRITGKRIIADEWMQLFTDAGLSDLPFSPE